MTLEKSENFGSRRAHLIQLRNLLFGACALPVLWPTRILAQSVNSALVESRFVTNRGSRTHYTVSGSGPLVVLLHGFTRSAARWQEQGYVDLLSRNYTVAAIDALGHGKSDRPKDPQRYQQSERSSDVAAVIEDLGFANAHVIGYSMGGWQSVGVAKYFPERIASLTVGGWDLINGVSTALKALDTDYIDFPSFVSIMASNNNSDPQAASAWAKAEAQSGMHHCWENLYDLDGIEQAVTRLDVPVLLWNGREDAYHDPMQQLASRTNLQFLSTSGDHQTAFAKGILRLPLACCSLCRQREAGSSQTSPIQT